jgi:multidrug efflux pump
LAFLPIVIMPGPAGEFVGGIALSVIFVLIGSYIISHTLIAVFAGRFLPKSNQNGFFYNGINPKGISLTFKKVLAYSISKPKSTLLLTMCLPFLGFMSAGQLTEQFFPSADRDMFQIEVRLSVNNSLQSTESTVNKMSHYIKKYEGIEQVNWMVGSNIPIFYYNMIQRDKGAKNYAQAMVKVTDFERANTLIKQLQIDLDRAFPEAQTLVRKLEQGPPFNAPIELRIYGPNLDRLTSIGSKIRTRLISHPKVTHTRATLESGSAKVLLLANEHKLSHAGVKLTDVAKQLNSQFEGVAVGSVLEETETVPVRLRVSPSKSSTIDSIQNTQFIGSEPLLLSAFSEAKIVPARNSIQRRNGQRVNIIEAFLVSDILPAQVLNDIELFIEQQQNALPPGYTIEVGGESQKRDEAVSRLLGKVGVIVVLLFSILVVSFNSFRITSIILMSALQSAFLGLLCVYIVGYPFGFTVIVALLGLMGLAINAAIVILSELQTSDLDTQYDDINKHIIASVMTCGRHISSTTITTVGGFLPLILAGGGFWPPFAVAIAGGTLLTTILSFFFVPAMYKVMRVHTN